MAYCVRSTQVLKEERNWDVSVLCDAIQNIASCTLGADRTGGQWLLTKIIDGIGELLVVPSIGVDLDPRISFKEAME